MMVEMGWDGELAQVLGLVGVGIRMGRVGDVLEGGVDEGMMMVEMTGTADGLLEGLIDGLSEIRWRYEEGRRLQMELWSDESD